MGQAFEAAYQVGAGLPGHRIVVRADIEITAHARREVHHHVGVLFADAVDHLPVELHGAGALPGIEVAHVAVDNGRPSRSGVQRGGRDLFRGDRHMFTAPSGVS